ncbi:hypothetical protein HPB49_014150 [Dermacentor silvarum]|uniref:Uncharacterized protein n=1 Tax=Dermacentor silvarum TaxID=543639 RepID=A0ACB8C451_DERSI|nr:hypothetical protein HPB49_014150 [Dermacentor silvarum]
MKFTVQGRSAEKGELDATDWITVLNKCNLEKKWARKAKFATEEVKVIDTPSAKRDGKQQAEKSIASNQIEWNKARQLVKNEKQGIFVFFNPSTEARDKLLRLTHLDSEGKVHEMTVLLAVPDDFSRGVIHDIGLNTSLQKIKQGIAEHEENPKILVIRRLGQSKTIMLTFTTKEGHDCNPTYKLSGQPHPTGDKTCKEIFRTPYIVKKRQWEKLQQQEEEEQELPEHRSRQNESKSRARSKERLRSTFIPRLPQQATTTPHKKQGAPPTKKVGWEAGNSMTQT